MHADVLLAPYGFYFDLEGKLARQKVRAPNPFVDPDELGRHVSEMKKDFEEALQAQENSGSSRSLSQGSTNPRRADAFFKI